MPEDSSKGPGIHGHIVSLGGITSRLGTGFVLYAFTGSVLFGTEAVALPANMLRKWALIVSDPDEEQGLLVSLGETGLAATVHLHLAPGGHILINELMPWTGAIYVDSDSAGTAVYQVAEASIQI